MDTDEAIRRRFDRRRPDLDVDAAWAAFERRRSLGHRTWRSRRLGLVAATLVLVVGAAAVVVALSGDSTSAPVRTGTSTTVPEREPDSWRRLPDGPLSARSGASAVWTGTEMIIAGGDEAPVCPPDVSCRAGHPDDFFADGAAYDPAADTWRTIAPAPFAFDASPAWWTGDEMLVVTDTSPRRRVLAYDPVEDRWDERTAAPELMIALHDPAWNGEIAVFVPETNSVGEQDWIYDPAADRWTELPASPIGCSTDRSVVATADSLVLFGVPCAGGSDAGDAGGGSDADGPPQFQAARFDLAAREWRRLPGSGIAGGSNCWVLTGDLVVNPGTASVDDGSSPTGGVLHLATESWTHLAPPGAPGEGPAPSAGTGYLGSVGAWVAAGVLLYEPVSGAWHVIPPGPEVGIGRAAVWTGHEIIGWGGNDEHYDGHLDTGVAYTPPAVPGNEGRS